MAFRQKHAHSQKERTLWQEWIGRHRGTLKGMGLPPEVYLSLGHWQDFLENGEIHWHPDDSTGFELAQLSRAQMERLCGFLEAYDEFRPEHFPLLGWLRVRLGKAEQAPPMP